MRQVRREVERNVFGEFREADGTLIALRDAAVLVEPRRTHVAHDEVAVNRNEALEVSVAHGAILIRYDELYNQIGYEGKDELQGEIPAHDFQRQ